MNWWMDSYDSVLPMRGALTNFTVWDTVLTISDMSNWSKCSLHITGNVLSWDTVTIGTVSH